MISAIQSTLGNDIQVRGCFYHLTQATWRKIQELGLVRKYRDDEHFKLFCGQLDALAFLPIEDIPEGITYIRTITPIDAEGLVDYFDQTYVTGTFRLAGIPRNGPDEGALRHKKKQVIKWIHGEEAHRYSDELYALRCKQAEILPLQQHFDLNDLLFFHKIVYNIIPVSLPNYISPYDGVSRQRASHLDHMSFVINFNTAVPLHKVNCSNKFFKSYFYRTLHTWNKLPLSIREIPSHVRFKLKVKDFLWSQVMIDSDLYLG